jgi:aconitate hydratase
MADGNGDSFGARGTLRVGDDAYTIYRLAAAAGWERLPFSLKVLLENVLRTEDGVHVTADQIESLSGWDPEAEPSHEIQFSPARVIMQDFTGVPCIVDLAAMREAMANLGGDPRLINPQVPAEMVIDHSVIVESFGRPDSMATNMRIEFERNRERYQLLRWGQQAFDNFRVVPPGTGIIHQVNLEHLARVVMTADAPDGPAAYPDTVVGTDSHTTMINGAGVLGWGVGGIEAEAAMLGQPVSMLVPRVVGFKLTGRIPVGVTATDVVLTITQLLRAHGVVGKFVEFYGEGVASVPLANRATIGNMSPEFGSTAAIFPIDQVTIDYLRLTGRDPKRIALVEAYAKEQGLWHDPAHEPVYSEYLELDLGTVVPSIAGPKRPQDRIALSAAKRTFEETVGAYTSAPARSVTVQLDDQRAEIGSGDVAVAAITSCTNTSNPSVMVAAGLLARNAGRRGLKSKPWVKTSLAPGSQVVTEYLDRAGLTADLDRLGFNTVGYGCTTCIGNTGPLPEAISAAVNEHDLAVTAVLSGNRNFEGRISPDVKMNYLASPPLVIAYALAGTMDFDFEAQPLGRDDAGQDVYLRDLWPSSDEIEQTIADSIDAGMYAKKYADVFRGDERWRSLDVPASDRFGWDPESTYIRKPPFFDGLGAEPAPVADIHGARVLALLGDSVTTDHISPAGAIKADSPAGHYLTEHGVARRDFNSYGSRRGNHEVMIRGTFGNIRLRNQLLDDVQGGFTRDFTRPGGPQDFLYDAAEHYRSAGLPLIVVAGSEYGTGSSRDWAAKGTMLLGVRAVIARSFERIHRSNLIGMGVVPLQFRAGESADALGLDGTESYSISGLDAMNAGSVPEHVHVIAEPTAASAADRTPVEFDADVRIDTPGEAEYYRHGGILQYVLRQLAQR